MTGQRVGAAGAGALLGLLISACTGSSCRELATATAERDRARAAFGEVTKRVEAGTADQAELAAAHDVMHELDQRVYGLDAACD